jgi:hypothetical protein
LIAVDCDLHIARSGAGQVDGLGEIGRIVARCDWKDDVAPERLKGHTIVGNEDVRLRDAASKQVRATGKRLIIIVSNTDRTDGVDGAEIDFERACCIAGRTQPHRPLRYFAMIESR